MQRAWLRNRSFDLQLQLGALLGVAPPLLVYALLAPAEASSYLSLAALVAIPFVHVFGSFFYAFSGERNQSETPPRQLLMVAGVWLTVVLGLQQLAPRGLATFALIYGGWHIARQNFGFLRELVHKTAGPRLSADRTLRQLDNLATLAPALALWLLISTRGPWRFISDDVYHFPVPVWMLVAAFALVLVGALLRELRLRWLLRRAEAEGAPVPSPSQAGALLLVGNAAALLVPALLLDDLTLIYTLAASYHGFQYLSYLAARESERHGRDPLNAGTSPLASLLPLAGAVALMMMVWFVVLLGAGWLLGPMVAERVLLTAWYAIVPFHYFVDGRIWQRPRRALRAPAATQARLAFFPLQSREPTCSESPS